MANAIDYKSLMEALCKPFEPKDLEWRAQSATLKSGNNGGYRVLIVPYVTSRAIMNRLDEVAGAMWKDEYTPVSLGNNHGIRCILSLKIGDEWIRREDGAETSKMEPIKGGYSNALKRAGVKWGIGRYLYDLPPFWVDVLQQGQHYVNGQFKIKKTDTWVSGYYNTPKLPDFAVPKNTIQNQQPQLSPNQPKQENGKQDIPINPAERQKNALNHVIGIFQALEVPVNLVPHLLETASGSKAQLEQASAEELSKLYKALLPVKNYVDGCRKIGINEHSMLDFAQITLAKPFNEIYELFFVMTKESAEKTLELIRGDMQQSTQMQGQSYVS